jgi:mono/diheme cytochrome c family protein
VPRLLSLGVLSMAAALGAAACTTAEARGRQIYLARGCAACHGPEGRGDGPTAKRLDIPPRDFADPRAYSEGAGPKAIATSIRRGAGAMPAFRDLTEEEALDIAAWIVTLQHRPDGAGAAR